MEAVSTDAQDLGRPVRVTFQCEIEAAVRAIIEYVGEDPDRQGLLDTPSRVSRALREMCRGYGQRPEEILAARFDADYDQMVVLRGVRFTSLCEHHLLPFLGEATVAYIPDGHVVGISKLARLVECFACRLQIQERMTTEIARAVMEHLEPLGVGVIIRAHHSCMGCRGAKQPEAEMITSELLGVFREEARQEFLQFHYSRFGG